MIPIPVSGLAPGVRPAPQPVRPARVVVSAPAVKISQLIGDYDQERQKPTDNLTATRYKLTGTDLGVPFRHKDRTYLLFGDTLGPPGGDAIAFTTDVTPENGMHLEFLRDRAGTYKPLVIPGIPQAEFEVPVEGVSVGGRMYVYHTTDATHGPGWDKMGRSVLAVSDDDGQSFSLLYELSRRNFINVSVDPVESAAWPGLPPGQGGGLMMFGSGDYRRSNVFLAYQPAAAINTRESMRYWAGLDGNGQPVWSLREEDGKSLFNQPCVGELSVSFNRFIKKWIMLYNCDNSNARGINVRTADQPWGPWSEPKIIFHPWDNGGYCHFIHVSWDFRNCDRLQSPGLEKMWGGEYGAYQFRDLATGTDGATTIYFTMSTWNPYTVVLMKASLKLEPG